MLAPRTRPDEVTVHDAIRSDLDERFLALCHEHGLPRPRVNATVAGPEVDFVFADQRLVVETDRWRSRPAAPERRRAARANQPAGARGRSRTERYSGRGPGRAA